VATGFTTRRTVVRLACAGGGLAALVGGVVGLSPSSASARAPRYPIHVEAVGSASSSSQQVVITGAFADAGQLTVSGPRDAVALSKGSILLDLSAGEKAENALFNHLGSLVNPKTCGINASYKAPVKIVSGTGSYQGITGSLVLTTQEVGVFPKSPDGSCNLSSNAAPVGFLSLASGSGTASLRES